MDNTFGEKSRQNFRIEIENKNTIIKEITDFDLEQTLECGQCFRFYKQDEEDYVVVAFNKLLHIKQSGNQLIFFNTEKPDVENIWIPYFDLERDYNEVYTALIKIFKKLWYNTCNKGCMVSGLYASAIGCRQIFMLYI